MNKLIEYISVLYDWLRINTPQIVQLCGFLLLAIAGFKCNVIAGLIVSGIELLVISFLSDRR